MAALDSTTDPSEKPRADYGCFENGGEEGNASDKLEKKGQILTDNDAAPSQ